MAFLPFFFVACLGALVASFVGVIAERAYTGQSWIKGRSRCNSCARELSAPDLVPVLSFLLTLGRCRTCGASVPALYAASELLMALLFVLSYRALGASLELVLFLAALSILLFIVLYDLRHTIVPPAASFALALSGFAFLCLEAPSASSFGGALIAAGAIGLAFVLMHALSHGKWMGLGDAPVAFALALLIAPLALTGLVLSFWTGAVIGIAILFLRRGRPRMGIEVPFVPFLAAGFLLAYFAQWNLFPF